MNVYLAAALSTLVYFVIFFIVAQIVKNNSIVDIGWGPGFAVISWVVFIVNPSTEALIIPVLVTLWALRLFLHISVRNIGKGEDYRYVAMRESWGDQVVVTAFFRIFMFQGLLQYLVALPIIGRGLVVEIPILVYFGIGLFIVGLFFETVGDAQLKAFVKARTNREQIMKTGLWRYTRHPNYFGDACVWWGIFLVALSLGAPIWTIVGPIVMNVLLRYVSGVPYLERRYANNPAYQAYKKYTSIFIPLPPKQ